MHRVRRAEYGDASAMATIWGQRLVEDQPDDIDSAGHFQSLLKAQDSVFQCWVLDVNGEVQGWVALSPMRNSPSLWNTMAEVSLYLARNQRGNRYGRILLEHAKRQAEYTPLEWLWAFVGKSNSPVQLLVEFLGFDLVCELSPVSKKPDRDRILVYVCDVQGSILR